MTDHTTDRVTDNTTAQRFEMRLDAPSGATSGAALAFIAYRWTGDVLVLDHAEVPPAFEGRGTGSRLVKATLEEIRARGLKVTPRCGFVRAYLRRHPEFNDLLAP